MLGFRGACDRVESGIHHCHRHRRLGTIASHSFLCPSDVLEKMLGAPIRQLDCYLAASSDLRQTIDA